MLPPNTLYHFYPTDTTFTLFYAQKKKGIKEYRARCNHKVTKDNDILKRE